ncbi:hypothetical protein EV363DRAFT_1301808 [Boletus edulis]|nr:hypothetical protein EV363DRAFT_1301808 [Boletus edulis]
MPNPHPQRRPPPLPVHDRLPHSSHSQALFPVPTAVSPVVPTTTPTTWPSQPATPTSQTAPTVRASRRRYGLKRGLDVVPVDAPECRQEHSAPCTVVEMTQRRAVRHKHVGLGWLSMSVIVCITLDRWGWEEGGMRVLKGPRAVLGGVGTPVDTQCVVAHGHLSDVIFKVGQRGVCLADVCACFGLCERTVVVAPDKELDRVGWTLSHARASQSSGRGTRLGEVAGVEENVASRKGWLCVVGVVNVGDADG